jgi:hypothetical protein
MMTRQENWNETARLDGESLRGLYNERIKGRRVLITDREDRVRMNLSLVGAVVISVAAPGLLLIVGWQVLKGRRTIRLVKSADTAVNGVAV